MKKQVIKELKYRFGGYKFAEQSSKVFHSEAISNCFSKEKIEYFWSEKVQLESNWKELLKEPKLFNILFYHGATENVEKFALIGNPEYLENGSDRIVGNLFQGGFLTIKKASKREKSFDLKIPNKDIQISLFNAVKTEVKNKQTQKIEENKAELIEVLENDDWKNFFRILRTTLKSGFDLSKLGIAEYTKMMTFVFKAIGLIDENIENSFKVDSKTNLFFTYKGKAYIIENMLKEDSYETMQRDEGFDHIMSTYYKLIKENYNNMPVYIIGINFQMIKNIHNLKSKDLVPMVIKYATNGKSKRKIYKLKAKIKTLSRNELKYQIYCYFCNVSAIDNFYMKRVEETENVKTVSHLEGHYFCGLFEIKNEDSYSKHKINEHFKHLIDKPEILNGMFKMRGMNKKE
eukprot:GAHX01002184.1.p1 GENE.GAHX01002184.1~~GAHX01002184.1.p1  ORF type:complete len:403 (-),score=82.10 GAHX01002184.1:114-1322(-)